MSQLPEKFRRHQVMQCTFSQRQLLLPLLHLSIVGHKGIVSSSVLLTTNNNRYQLYCLHYSASQGLLGASKEHLDTLWQTLARQPSVQGVFLNHSHRWYIFQFYILFVRERREDRLPFLRGLSSASSNHSFFIIMDFCGSELRIPKHTSRSTSSRSGIIENISKFNSTASSIAQPYYDAGELRKRIVLNHLTVHSTGIFRMSLQPTRTSGKSI